MMSKLETIVREICQAHGRDRTRMMDIVAAVQAAFGHVSHEALEIIGRELMVPRVEVEGVVTFYSFFSTRPRGQVVIRLCNDVADKMAGADRVAQVLSEELGIRMGETTPDGHITLEETACIGMCDQAPAALVNDVVVTELSSDKAREIARSLKAGGDPRRLVRKLGDGNNAHELVGAMVKNNLRLRGPVIFADWISGSGLANTLSMSPQEVIRLIKTARLRGRGGAGFPTGMKWEFTRVADGPRRYVICNADEGEPGTFKDRVILTEAPDLLFEGMAIAGYAVGAEHGIVYLRGEYAYLRRFLESVIERRRAQRLLGADICGKRGFNFDIHIQMGAGAYVCGEESALISSCEGLRGDPKTRPPFPAQKGYLGFPTTVNNVETLCCAARIVEKGAGWFAQLGSSRSSGTKLLSISGDCMSPGVYELPFGVRLAEVLKIAGAADAVAVQMGGPSGQMVGVEEFERTLCYDDLATGGAVTVFGRDRDLLDVVRQYMRFFVHESCGYCTPCRVGNVLLLERLDRIIAGKGEVADLEYLEQLAGIIKTASRCGLGQSSPNPIVTTLERFREEYERRLARPELLRPSFNLAEAVAEAEAIAGRRSVHHMTPADGQDR